MRARDRRARRLHGLDPTLEETCRSASQPPPLAINALAGRDLFEFYCATCHGRDGKGAGPVAGALKTRPADLTALGM